MACCSNFFCFASLLRIYKYVERTGHTLSFKNVHHSRNLVTSSSLLKNMYESDPKSGYGSKEKIPFNSETIREGFTDLKNEIILWKSEFKDRVLDDPIILHRPGEIDKVYEFNSEDSLSLWVSTADSDHGEGFSTCDFKVTPGKKGLFHGVLSTDIPKDGRIKSAGYCNIRSVRKMKSFKRNDYHDWTPYTHIVFKVRGDGRNYAINLSTEGFFDVTWNDVYTYVLHTRGGPYWQVTKIPFSKFFFTSKGRTQDKQFPLEQDRISHVGFTAADKINGPFRLEIDYIGLEYDPAHTEEFAYEMYEVDKFIADT